MSDVHGRFNPFGNPSYSIIYQDPAQLHPNPRNPRTHSTAQIHQIGASIRQFGFVTPVLVDAQRHDRSRPRPGRGGQAYWPDQHPDRAGRPSEPGGAAGLYHRRQQDRR